MIKALLILVPLGLAGVLYVQWNDWPPPETPAEVSISPDAAKASSQSDPVVELDPLEEKEDYVAITERPLFRPDRRPPEEEPEVEPEAPPDEAGDLAGMDVTGILIAPKLTSAWVKDPSQPTPVRLRPGETLAGWTVKDILADRLVMERQGKTDELLLRAFNAPGVAPPQPQPLQRSSVPSRQLPRAARPNPRIKRGVVPFRRAPATRRPSAGNQNARPNVR